MTSSGKVLTHADPRSLGFDPDRLTRIRGALERDIAAGLLPGAVVGIARRGQVAYLDAIGARDVGTGQPMTTEAVFSIASMTKPMTSAAIMMLCEEGRLLLGDPVSKFLPQFANMKVAKAPASPTLDLVPALREMTVQDLLRHTSGLTYRDRGQGAAFEAYPNIATGMMQQSKEEFLSALARVPLIYQPGTVWEYGLSTDVLGFIVEAVTGESLGQFLHKRLWAPLGMVDTSFDLTDETRPRYAAALPADPLTGKPQYMFHAGGQRAKWHSGGGGSVSTAADYLRFAQMMLNGGHLGSARILGRKTVELMRADHLGGDIQNRLTSMDAAFGGYGFGLGFAVRQTAGGPAASGSIGDHYWSGVFGTYFWIDPTEQLVGVFMAAAPGQMRLRYRQLLRNLVLQAVVD